MKNIFNIFIETFVKEKIEGTSGMASKRMNFMMNLKDSAMLNKNFMSNNVMSHLNYNLFLQSLALASFYSTTHEEKGVVEKVIYLADKMGNSLGIKKSQLLSGQTL